MGDADLRERVAVLETEAVAHKEALGLQAEEYERRLHELNNAHERQREDQIAALKVAREDQLRYLSRDEHVAFIDTVTERIERLKGSIAILYGLDLTLFLTLVGALLALKLS
jgi:hypothetical protein